MSGTYEDIEFTQDNFPFKDAFGAEFLDCRFGKLDLAGTRLANCRFIDCEFFQCDLSNASLTGASLRGAIFRECKVLGVNFSSCASLGDLKFEESALNYSIFQNCDILDFQAHNCSLVEVDFSGASLKEASFKGSSLSGSAFEGSDLRKSDFREAMNYRIDPSSARLSKAKFSMPGVLGLLSHLDIEIE